MRRLALLPLLLLAAGCSTYSSTTTVYEPAAQASANYWAGVFWTAAVVVAGVSLVAWAIAWAVVEGRRQ